MHGACFGPGEKDWDEHVCLPLPLLLRISCALLGFRYCCIVPDCMGYVPHTPVPYTVAQAERSHDARLHGVIPRLIIWSKSERETEILVRKLGRPAYCNGFALFPQPSSSFVSSLDNRSCSIAVRFLLVPVSGVRRFALVLVFGRDLEVGGRGDELTSYPVYSIASERERNYRFAGCGIAMLMPCFAFLDWVRYGHCIAVKSCAQATVRIDALFAAWHASWRRSRARFVLVFVDSLIWGFHPMN